MKLDPTPDPSLFWRWWLFLLTIGGSTLYISAYLVLMIPVPAADPQGRLIAPTSYRFTELTQEEMNVMPGASPYSSWNNVFKPLDVLMHSKWYQEQRRMNNITQH